MFSRTLTQAGHVRSFVMRTEGDSGWEVRIEEDDRLVRQKRYSDWHRLERALGLLQREIGALQAQGWRELPGAAGARGQSTNL